MIAQPAAEALSTYLRDYLTAGQAGKVAVGFWPMLWEQGRFFFGVCVLGLTALGTVGIPVPLRGAGIFVCPFSVAGFCRAFGPVGLGPALFLFGLPAFLWGLSCFWRGPRAWRGSRKPVSDGQWGRERAASLQAALLGASGPLGTGAVPVCCAGISGRARLLVCLSPVCAVIGINM